MKERKPETASSYFSRNRKIQFGQVCVRGLRITVNFIKARHRGGDSIVSIARSYQLPIATIRAAIRYGVKSQRSNP